MWPVKLDAAQSRSVPLLLIKLSLVRLEITRSISEIFLVIFFLKKGKKKKIYISVSLNWEVDHLSTCASPVKWDCNAKQYTGITHTNSSYINVMFSWMFVFYFYYAKSVNKAIKLKYWYQSKKSCIDFPNFSMLLVYLVKTKKTKLTGRVSLTENTTAFKAPSYTSSA